LQLALKMKFFSLCGMMITADVEYPIQLAYTREPVMCLAGTVSAISPGRRDLALSKMEWQDLELPEVTDRPATRCERF
jgi:hypothetical protein